LTEDYRLVLRQVISVLDKVISKPRRLNACHIETYVDRTLVAAELWTKLSHTYGSEIRQLERGEEAFREFEATWLWKVHPYAEHQSDARHPENDANAKVIKAFGRNDVTRERHRGRWHDAFWREADGKPDYPAIAVAIWSHLFEQELKIDGARRLVQKLGAKEPKGLIAGRGETIANSATSPLHRDEVREARTALKRSSLKEAAIQDIYFVEDIAAGIANAVKLEMRSSSDGRPPAFSALFGRMLYEHFGRVGAQGKQDESTARELWAFHNQVRKFYRDLAGSTRFRLAVSGATKSVEKVAQLLPQDRGALLRVLQAKLRNTDVSAQIRLGKIVAHASDITREDGDPQAAFVKNLAFYATSEGQSAIKRNETFTRVWRTSVALSLRTLEVLAPVDPKLRHADGFDTDPASTRYAKDATRSSAEAALAGRLALLFGAKPVSASGQSRVELLMKPADAGQIAKASTPGREVLWALLRIAGEIRNGTNHFNTKRRLVSLLTRSILDWKSDPVSPDNRRATEAHEIAKTAFDALLDSDIDLRRQIVLDDFRRLKVHEYVPASSIDELFGEFARSPDGVGLTMPKFISLLGHASKTAQADGVKPPAWAAPFARLDLSNLSKAGDTANTFVIGILRHLYASGFAAWVADKQSEAGFVRKAFDDVLQFKRQRFDAYQREQAEKGRGRFYALAEAAADALFVNKDTTLDALIGELQALAMRESSVRRTYRAEAHVQREHTNWVGDFKLDLFSRLFAEYLAQEQIGWIWRIDAKLPEGERADPAALERHAGPKLAFARKDWHAPFYVWLYLLPSDEIALLRHQFLKTRALEKRAEEIAKRGQPPGQKHASEVSSRGSTDDATLAELDHLMGLQLSVSSAGFSGTEHVGAMEKIITFDDARETELISLLLKDSEVTDATLPGTNRGLRQLLSLGTHAMLAPIFKKHPVTRAEIDALKLETNTPAERSTLFTRRNDLAKDIQAMAKDKKATPEDLKLICKDYQKTSSQAAIYNFLISGARLRDHVRLHQLMMRILTRLMDYSLMWERDRQYVYLGMLFGRLQAGHAADGAPAPVAVLWDEAGERLGFALPAGLKGRLAAVYPAWFQEKSRDGKVGPSLVQPEDAAAGFLPVWHARYGYVLDGDRVEVGLLDGDDLDLFRRYFDRATVENAKDTEARKTRRNENKPKSPRGSRQDGRRKVRNDFAHFNMLNARHRPNFSYLVNSIRALLAYDRKLKNAVSQSIADMAAQEGLILRWELDNDRLQHAKLIPKLTPHLDYVRIRDEASPAFALPQVSPRFASMVKALFDFSPGGYRKRIVVKGEETAAGELSYPVWLWEETEALGTKVPDSIKDLHYPALGSD
jgi:hypothetical protein